MGQSEEINKYNAYTLLPYGTLKWVLIDFDKTIANHDKDFRITEPLPHVQESLKQLQDDGYKIHIFTARPWMDYVVIETFCNDHQIPFDKIICGKPLATLIIDDKAFHFKDWQQDLPEIRKRLNKVK